MQKLLAKYVYRSYYALLHDSTFNLELSRYGWIRPAVIPNTPELRGNRLIRKHVNHRLVDLIKDFEFERILCRAGYQGHACGTTTSTTTTSTTTA